MAYAGQWRQVISNKVPKMIEKPQAHTVNVRYYSFKVQVLRKRGQVP